MVDVRSRPAVGLDRIGGARALRRWFGDDMAVTRRRPVRRGYWDHRWAKLVEHVTFDKSVEAEAMRSGLARFAAREATSEGQQPMEVRLVSIQSAAGERSELQIYQLAFSEGGP